MKRLADSRASGPVRNEPRDRGRRPPPRPLVELACDARQTGGEDERFRAVAACDQPVHEIQQHARVALHRAADVAEQDERTPSYGPRPPRYGHDLSTEPHVSP